MSGGEPSSIKRSIRCAAGAPALSNRYVRRIEVMFDFEVYGLILQLISMIFSKWEERLNASGTLQKMAPKDL